MSKYPSIFKLESLLKLVSEVQVSTDSSGWVPARPRGYPSLRHRFRCAWLVLTGKGDVVIWPGNQ